MDALQFWKLSDKLPRNADCFIILSYGVENHLVPTAPTREIIKLAANWQKKFPGAYLIMSTGDNQKLGATNARVMKNYALSLGVAEHTIIEEGLSKTTVENLKFSRDIMNRKKLKTAVLVTYDLHIRRTLKIANKLGFPHAGWITVGSPGSPAYGIKKFQTFSRVSIFVYEILAYVYNKFRNEL